MPRPDSPPVTKGVILRALGFGIAVILGAIAVWLIVTGTNSPKRIEIGVLAGLWGLLLGAYTMFGSRRLGTPGDFGPSAPAPTGSDVALRSSAEVERVAEAAVRRVFEEQLEGLLSRYINSSMSHEVSELRDEISRLRQDLVEKVGGQLRLERIETTRLIGSDLEALQHEVRKLTVANEGVLPGGLTLERPGDPPRVTSVRQIVEPARVRPVSRPTADVEADVQPAVQSGVPVARQQDAAPDAQPDARSADLTRSMPAAGESRVAEPTAEAAKAQAARAEAAKAEAAKGESRKAEAAKLTAIKADEAKFEARRVEAAKVEAMRLEAQRAEAARLEARRAEVAKAEAAQREARRAEAAKSEAARLKAQQAETARLEARKAEVAKAEAARAEASKVSGARAAHATATDETGPLGAGLPPIRSAAQRAAASQPSRHGSASAQPVEPVSVEPVPAEEASSPVAATAPIKPTEPIKSTDPAQRAAAAESTEPTKRAAAAETTMSTKSATRAAAAESTTSTKSAKTTESAVAPATARPTESAEPITPAAKGTVAPEPTQPAVEPAASAEPAAESDGTWGWPSRTEDPFASLPRITPFTEFALDPIETPTNGSATNGAINAANATGGDKNGSGNGNDAGPNYTGRRRRNGEPEPVVDDRGRHSRGEVPAEPEPQVRRRRRADENDDGEDLLARLLAARNADH